MNLSRLVTPALFTAILLLPWHDTARPQQQVQKSADLAARLRVPPGFVVECVAAPPLVGHPMMAGFDEAGRLYIAESAGENLKKDDLLKVFPNFIRRLEPADAQGVFHKGRVWADKMTFPMGALWHNGALYAGSPPSMWKLEDTKGVGVSDRRTELVTKFGFTGNAADIHGPFLGPDGRLYWCDGRHGHEIPRPDGTIMKGKAARIFRCKADGSEVEVVCGGGMDNPVEIAFTDEGEPFATVDILHNQPSRNDAIIFAIEGGVYPWHDVYKEFPSTGDLLPAVADLGWVAPSGMMRYRSGVFGTAYTGNLFTAQFNRHRIQRHILERDGAGFKVKTEDFLTSDDNDFHPTDVLEDADGSLLVIDTGGWFRIGCPTSQIAKPEIKGAIYRVRKQDAKQLDDPRGLNIPWGKLSPVELTALLNDPRFMVRDRAIAELALKGADALAALQKVIEKSPSHQAVRNAVWALTRIEHPEARALVRKVVTDQDPSVRLAAIHSAGLHRDAKALAALMRLVESSDPATQRQAATALGRLKHPDALRSLMQVLEKPVDRFLEHAVIYAVIQINAPEPTQRYLSWKISGVRRAALIALDQMADQKLTRTQVTSQLAGADAALRKTVLDIVARRPSWGSEMVGELRNLLQGDMLVPGLMEPGWRTNLGALLSALSGETAIQELVVETLKRPKTHLEIRRLLLETIARAPLAKLPPAWIEALGAALASADAGVVQQAIVGLRERNLTQFDGQLSRLAHDGTRPAELRVAAFAAVAPRTKEVEKELFAFLLSELQPARPPLERYAAASALSKAKLNEQQLLELTNAIAVAGPLELPHLLGPFESASEKLAYRLIAALEASPGAANLTPAAVTRLLEKQPPAVLARAKNLLARITPDAAKQKAHLEELAGTLTGGNMLQGRDIFFGAKAACAACHPVNGKGGRIGPELGKIGAIRPARDLLESVVFPSVSFARGYESFVVETKEGKVLTGILVRETADAIYLVNAERQELRIGRDDIETIQPGRVSIMPQGLDTVLSREELRHLMAYLQSLR